MRTGGVHRHGCPVFSPKLGRDGACGYAKASRLGPNLLVDGWLVDMNGCEASNLSDGSALVV